MKKSKRYQKISTLVSRDTAHVLVDAVELLKKTASTKFDESVDFALVLGIDASKSDQGVRGACTLPHGNGRSVRVAVLADGEQAQEASKAGACMVGTEDLAEKIKGGMLDFDVLIATPSSMKFASALGQILGPRGLMPNPKTGTVTNDIATAVSNSLAGQAVFRNDRGGVIHTSVGKISFTSDKIADNIKALLSEIQKLKPSSSKGLYCQQLYLSATMGPSVRVDLAGLR